MTTLVRPIVQRSMTVYPNVAVAQPERSRTMPLPSASYTVSASGNVASTAVTASHPVRLRENSLVGTCFFFSDDVPVPINEPACASAGRTNATGSTHRLNVCPTPILQKHFYLQKCRARSSRQSGAHGN